MHTFGGNTYDDNGKIIKQETTSNSDNEFLHVLAFFTNRDNSKTKTLTQIDIENLRKLADSARPGDKLGISALPRQTNRIGLWLHKSNQGHSDQGHSETRVERSGDPDECPVERQFGRCPL